MFGLIALGCSMGLGASATTAKPRAIEVTPTGSAPAVTYNDRHGEFFVVWSENGIVGRAVSDRGHRLGRAVTIATGQTGPAAVAHSGERDEYLAVWTASNPSTGWVDLVGRRLDDRGRAIGGSFTIADRLPGLVAPSVAYSAVADRYLVAWTVNYWTTSGVNLRQLSGSGEPVAATSYNTFGCTANTAAAEGQAHWLTTVAQACFGRSFGAGPRAVGVTVDGAQSNTTISGATFAIGRVGVAANPVLQEYMTTFRVRPSYSPSMCPPAGCRPAGIYGRRVMTTGQAVGEEAFPILISDRVGYDADVAFNDRSEQYLAVWEQTGEDAVTEIYGQRLTGDGTLLAPEDFPISDEAAAEPVVVSGAAKRFLVAWQRPSGGVVAQHIKGR